MTADTEHLIIEMLRGIRGRVDAVHAEVREVRNRVSNVEQGNAAIRGDCAHLYTLTAEMSARLDGQSDRLEHIEKRLAIAG